MIDLTFEQIAAAKTNDLAAVSAVIEATEARVQQLARRYATGGGRTDLDLLDDLAQVGRIGVWEGLARFEGTTVAEFFTFIDLTVKGLMSSARKVETRPGVTRGISAEFERALSLADGDPYEAEKLAVRADVMGAKRMTPETAYAARLSYQGVSYLDAPVNNSSAAGEGYMTVGDMLADTVGVPAELLEPSDFERARREETRTKVHAVLDRMGKQQQTVLKALTGIDPVGYYGNENDDELAADYGIPRHRVMVIRSLGKTRFAALWNEAEEAAA